MRAIAISICLALFALPANATPDPATWHRQVLLGENAECFFRYVTVSEHPASYYSHRRTLRLEKVRKSDLVVVEQFPLRDVSYSEDPMTGTRSERSEALPAFDLAGYLAKNAVHLPFAEDIVRTFSIDSTGVWAVFEDGRTELAGRTDLRTQIPNLGEEPRVVGIERTDFVPAPEERGFLYLRIWSNSSAGDEDWSEDLLIVNRFVF